MMNTPYLPKVATSLPLLREHAEFWAYCQQRELRFQRCDACDTWRHPPAPVCKKCGCPQYHWDLAPNKAELFSFTVVYHAASSLLRLHVPYNIAIVDFPDLPDIRVVSNVVDASPEELRIGMPVALDWQDDEDGRPLPLFRRSSPAGR